MNEMNDLLESYYEELDPAKRLVLLNEYLEAADPGDTAAQYRKALYKYRYTDPKDPARKVDNYMLTLLHLMYLFRGSSIFPKRNVKQVLALMRDLEQDERVHTDDVFEEAFIMEVRNAVRRYFGTCKSAAYHKKLFGTTYATADEKETQRCKDTWRMSIGIAERLHLEKEMDLFCRAVAEEYRISRADGLTLAEAYRTAKK